MQMRSSAKYNKKQPSKLTFYKKCMQTSFIRASTQQKATTRYIFHCDDKQKLKTHVRLLSKNFIVRIEAGSLKIKNSLNFYIAKRQSNDQTAFVCLKSIHQSPTKNDVMKGKSFYFFCEKKTISFSSIVIGKKS